MKLTMVHLQQISDYFRRRPEVAAVYLYGSQADETAGELSDVDLGVLLKRQVTDSKTGDLQLQFISAIEDVTKTDLSADVKILNQDHALSYLASVIRQGKLLVINSPQDVGQFTDRISMLYADFYPVLADYYGQMRQRIAKGTYAAGH